MKLYYAPTSPYVRKVMILLEETGQRDDVELINVATTPVAADPALLSKNPLAKVPALERPDGPTLYDSRVITADGILDAALLMTYETRLRPEDKRMPEWVDGQWDKVARSVSALNTRWMSHLNGPLDMGQIAVACALAYVDFRHDARGWRKGNDGLAAWFKAFESRPSMQSTVPPAG
jgi:glutathione S-transferase